MPSTISAKQIGVWFCVGLFIGAGWTVAVIAINALRIAF